MLTLLNLRNKAMKFGVTVSDTDLLKYQQLSKQLEDSGSKNYHKFTYNFLQHEIHKVENDMFSRYRRIVVEHKGGLSHTYDRYVLSYGIYADQKWATRRSFMAEKNTFEYKSRTHGWTREQFDEYNSTRKQTRQRMIERHGVQEGSLKWEQYVEKQRTAGVSLQWFQDKHGAEEGLEIWKTVCKSKAHTIDNYTKKYGSVELATQKLIEKFSSQVNFHSIKSQVLFDAVVNELHLPVEHVYYATKNTEFGSFDPITKRYYKYDYVDTTYNICIEFNGDHYHGNPTMYQPTEFPKALRGRGRKTAEQCWEADTKKLAHIQSRGFNTIVVWEKDFDSDPAKVIDSIRAEYERPRN